MQLRKFHSSALQSFKQKSSGQTKKYKTPIKGKDGELRNFRKAAAYSNFQTNAPEAPHLKVLSSELGSGMFTYPEMVQKSLVHAGSFPPQQNSELFRTHTSLFRQQTLDVVNSLENSRKLLVGPSGIGKSTLLSQAQAVAKLNNWAVLHIPKAIGLIDGSTDHVASGDYYLQPMWVKRWFASIRKANKDVLSDEAIKILKSGDAAALDTFFEQLSKDNVKVLLSLDGINAWSYQPFAVNRNVDNEQIYHGDLQVPRVFLDFLSGARKLNGSVIASTTGCLPINNTINVALGRASSHGYEEVKDFDPVLSKRLENLEAVDVSYMTADEARTWLEYLSSVGVAPESTEDLIKDRYSLSGGNPRYLLRSFINFSF